MVAIIRIVSDLFFSGVFSALKLCMPTIEACVFNGVCFKYLGDIIGLVTLGGG